MDKPINKAPRPENSKPIESIDSTLTKLISEAEALFKLMDNTSNTIRHFEKNMTELKAFFSFRFCIKKEKESLATHLADYHKAIQYAESFSTQIYWYLAWEPVDENSKNYRLLLIADEKEIIHTNFDDRYHFDEFQSKTIFKKALIETDIQTRLKNAEYLNSFFLEFTEHLMRHRLEIELGNFNF